jgi:aspartyl aminopeptidase
MTPTPREIDLGPARDLLAYIESSPTPWHCAAHSAARLEAAGFSRLYEADPFELTPGAGYHLVRDGALIAFRLGLKPPADAGTRLIGAHTDSPNLRLKPNAEVLKAGYRTLGVEVYGGALHYSWLDRDLGLAGRVFVKGFDTLQPETRLVDLRTPLCRIPSLAIHLNREVNSDGLKLNSQQHLAPIFGMGSASSSPPAAKDEASALRTLLADTLGVSPEAVLAFDLCLVDVVPPALGGLGDAFVFAPRLDNQASCHAALSALIAAPPTDATQLVCLYDHEEVGSLTIAGADGPLVELVLSRLVSAACFGAQSGSESERFHRAMAKSWHVSADMAHAVHPNYEDRHEPQHKPVLNGGPVIKSNSNQRYATSGEGAALFEALGADCGVPIQKFVTRTDLACGTTIGPIAAGRLGVRTVDVGNPMLSMHSAREQCGSHDVGRMIAVLTRFLAL